MSFQHSPDEVVAPPEREIERLVRGRVIGGLTKLAKRERENIEYLEEAGRDGALGHALDRLNIYESAVAYLQPEQLALAVKRIDSDTLICIQREKAQEALALAKFQAQSDHLAQQEKISKAAAQARQERITFSAERDRELERIFSQLVGSVMTPANRQQLWDLVRGIRDSGGKIDDGHRALTEGLLLGDAVAHEKS